MILLLHVVPGRRNKKVLHLKPFNADHDCQGFANSLEPDQTPSYSASSQVPICLPLDQYFF